MGRESAVWPETRSRSMPGPFRSLLDRSNPLQGAVSGLVLEVQVGSTMSVRAQIIKNGPNRVQNQPFGLKLGPEACPDRSGAFGMGLTHSKGPSPAKKVKKCGQAAPGIRQGPTWPPAGHQVPLGPPGRSLAWSWRFQVGPTMSVWANKNDQKRKRSGPESAVWPETWSRSMPGPLRSLWYWSNSLQGAVTGKKQIKKCAQAAPG